MSATCLFLFFIIKVSCIEWELLNERSLRALKPSIFTSVSSKDISKIPTAACAGFLFDQIQNIFYDAIPGFSSAQLNKIPQDAVKGFTPRQVKKFNALSCDFEQYFIVALNDTSFSGFQRQCVENIPPEHFAIISEKQISNLTVNGASGITMLQMSNINEKNIKGFNSDHIAHFSNDACAGILGFHFKLFSLEFFGSISSECISGIPAETFAVISQTQVNKISPKSASGFNRFQTKKFPVAAYKGLTKNHIAYFNDEPDGGCEGLRDHISHCVNDVLANITWACFFKYYQNKSKQQVLGIKTVYIPVEIFGRINSSTMYLFNKNNDQQYFTKEQISHLSPSACEGIYSLSYFNPLNFGGFTPECISMVDYLAFSSLKADYRILFSVEAVNAISKLQINQFDYNFSREQISNLNIEPDGGCAGLGKGVSKLDSDQCDGFTPNCIRQIPSRTFLYFKNFRNFTLDAVNAISQNQMGFIERYASTFTRDQVANFGNNVSDRTSGCFGISDVFLASLQLNSVRGLNKECVSILKPYAVSGIPEKMFSYFSNDAISGLQPHHIKWLPTSSLTSLSLQQLKLFSSRKFTAAQIYRLLNLHDTKLLVGLYTAESWIDFLDSNNEIELIEFHNYFKGSNRTVFKSINETGANISNINWLQLIFIHDNATLKEITRTTIKQLPPISLIGLRGEIIKRMEPVVFSSFTSEMCGYLSPPVLEALTEDQFNALSALSFANLTYFYHIPPTKLPWISIDQFSSIAYHKAHFFEFMPCNQLISLTQEQLHWIENNDFFNEYDDRAAVCLEKPKRSGWEWWKIVAIVAPGVVVIFTIVSISLSIWYCKPSEQENIHQYEALPVIINDEQD